MKSFALQRGATLVVSLVMLLVLTLLVVSAIRFGNINVLIAGNTQVESEATSAAVLATEDFISKNIIQNNGVLSDLDAPTPLEVTVGEFSYNTIVEPPDCIFSRFIVNSELDPTKDEDQACYSGDSGDAAIGADGKLTQTLSECSAQQWTLTANVNDSETGANVTTVQGIEIRVPAATVCN